MTAPRDLDELASALLDGLLTGDEATAAKRDPAVVARLAELAAVREAVQRPPAGPDPVARERGMTAALAAFDAGDEAGEQRGTGISAGTTMSPLGRRAPAARPAAARRGTPRPPRGTAGRRWLTAAAIVLAVVGLGLGVVATNRDTGSDSSDTAASSSDDAERSDNATEEQPEGGAAEERAAPSVPSGGVVDLGDVDSPEALAEVVRSARVEGSPSDVGQAFGEDAADEGGGVPLAGQCADGALPTAGETIVLEARATLDGDRVDVWVLAADGKERVIAVDATCAVVVDQPLD